MPLHHSVWAEHVQFVDRDAWTWEQVRRTRYFCYQRFHYVYPGPIRNLKQCLVVVPPARYGDQRLVEHDLTVTPYPAGAQHHTDRDGNSVWELDVPQVEHEVAFEVMLTVERVAPAQGTATITPDRAARFLEPTRLTMPDERIREVARDLQNREREPIALAEAISAWVSDAFRYGSGVTSVSTPAAQALALGKGLCQDYAHVMLTLCRVAGLPARYVSGHMLGEGGSHAWVEVFLPTPNGDVAPVGFDPTNRRRPNLGYTTVAVGRDYSDVPPTSGSFSAPYGGRLSFTKRAGLTLVELTNGDVIEASGVER